MGGKAQAKCLEAFLNAFIEQIERFIALARIAKVWTQDIELLLPVSSSAWPRLRGEMLKKLHFSVEEYLHVNPILTGSEEVNDKV